MIRKIIKVVLFTIPFVQRDINVLLIGLNFLSRFLRFPFFYDKYNYNKSSVSYKIIQINSAQKPPNYDTPNITIHLLSLSHLGIIETDLLANSF